jgi:selenocysteine lyase/cysteine desulfurase
VAVVVSWVQFATGFVADLARIGEACQSNGVFFIVDGIQGCGVRPIDLKALAVDVFASGAQKWQLGPWGTGFVYVRRGLVEQLEPHNVGWASMRASTDYTKLTEYEFDFYPDARRFEVVTLAYHDFAVVNASTALLLNTGVETIAQHIEQLVGSIVHWAESRDDVQLITPSNPERRAGVVAFAPRDLADMHRRLRSANVVHVVREGAIRLAPHCYNTTAEIDTVVNALNG